LQQDKEQSMHNTSLSMIGGAAQGGSAKPKEERESMDRQHGQEPQPNPVGSESQREGSVGGNSNDNRTDQERASGNRGTS
jgi:hypothetical protein